MIKKLRRDAWLFGNSLVDLETLALYIDQVADCTHHPRNALAMARSIFSGQPETGNMYELWHALLQINNKAHEIPDEVWREIGSVTDLGTWRNVRTGKLNGYPFPWNREDWVQLVKGKRE